MGWTRRANPKWVRKACKQNMPSEVRNNISTDRFGNIKKDNYNWDWTGSSYIDRRYVARCIRAAHKIQIQQELFHYEEWLLELDEQYADENWYDDEPMDLPDWWYGYSLEHEYPPEPEEEDEDEFWNGDPFWDDHYDFTEYV